MAINTNTLPTKILTLEEIRIVLHDLNHKILSQRAVCKANAWHRNLIVFRLSCCCGLRSKEIRHLRLSDFLLNGTRPVIRIRKETTKGMNGRRRARLVPLWWDKGTLNDLQNFYVWRMNDAGGDENAYCIMDSRARQDRAPTRDKMHRRWFRAIRALPEARQKQLSIHCGRHSFCSHALHNGRSLAEVRDAAGHTCVSMTQTYIHALETGELPDVFPEDDD
ncbi:MAG: site-specific integrase [Planctomycetota bacterium]